MERTLLDEDNYNALMNGWKEVEKVLGADMWDDEIKLASIRKIDGLNENGTPLEEIGLTTDWKDFAQKIKAEYEVQLSNIAQGIEPDELFKEALESSRSTIESKKKDREETAAMYRKWADAARPDDDEEEFDEFLSWEDLGMLEKALVHALAFVYDWEIDKRTRAEKIADKEAENTENEADFVLTPV